MLKVIIVVHTQNNERGLSVMKEALFGYFGSSSRTTYVAQLEQWLLIAFAAIFIATLLLLLVNKSSHVKKTILLSCVLAMIILEIVKYVYRYNFMLKNGLVWTVWEVMNINLVTLVTWITIVLCLASMGIDKDNGWKRFCNSFIFSMGTIAGALLFIYPSGLNPAFAIYHISNVQLILSSLILLFTAMYIGFTDFLRVDIHDLWLAVLSLAITTGMSYGIYYMSNRTCNIMFVGGCSYLEKMGITLQYPLNILPILAIIFMVQVVMYIPFELHDKRRMSGSSKVNNDVKLISYDDKK